MSARDEKPRGPGPGLFVLLAGFAAVLGVCLWGLWLSRRMEGFTGMTIHGWIALGLALVLGGALSGGLMWLAFYSARKGYDDDAGDGREE